uniref:Uncharacterized protein n=1 Tax=Arundo donax TaxID=35708 RepID=A0A0A9F742_ARUDO
MAAAAPAR